jgi:hypothetical protein
VIGGGNEGMDWAVLLLCEAEPPVFPGNMSGRKAWPATALLGGPVAPLVLGTETEDLEGPVAAPFAFIGCDRLVDKFRISFPWTMRLSLDFLRSLVSISINKRKRFMLALGKRKRHNRSKTTHG